MIQTTLAAALLAATAGTAGPSIPPEQDAVLGLLPLGSPLVVAFGDVAGHLGAEDPAAWIRFLTDDRLRESMLFLMEADAEFATDGFDKVLGVVRCIRGGGLAMTDLDVGAGVAALKVTDGFVPALRALVEAGGEVMTEATVLGADGYRVETGAADGITMVEMSGLMLIGIGVNDIVEADMRSVAAAMEDGPDEERWWTATGVSRVEAPLLEVFLSLDVIAEMEDEFATLFPDSSVGYFGMGVGEGNEGEVALSIGLGDNDVFSTIAGAFGTADAGLMQLAPADAMSATVLNVDLLALIQAGLDMAAYDEARETYEASIEAASSTLGVDIEDEILGNLTGDILMVQWPTNATALTSTDPTDLLEIAPAIVFGIADSEPFYTLIETAEGLMGPEGLVTEELDGGTMWSTEPLPGLEVAAALSESRLVIGAKERVEDLLSRASSEVKSGMLDGTQLAFARERLGGAYIGVAEMSTTWSLMLDALALEPEALPAGAMTLFEVASEYLGGVMYADTHFTKDRIELRMLTR